MAKQKQLRVRSYLQRDMKGVDYELRRFGKSLKAPKNYAKDARRLINKVLRTLQKESKYSIGRHELGGSYAKKTDVNNPDIDTVIRVKNCESPFHEVLDDWENVLKVNGKYLQICTGVYKKSLRSLKFSFKNGIPVDLLPAADVNEDEMRLILRKWEGDRMETFLLGPALVKDQVDFFKSKSYYGFTNTVVRLSKFCLKSWYFGGERYSSGSAIIELIAVAAVENQLQLARNDLSEFRALREVMVMLTKLDTIKLAFCRVDHDGEPKWELVKPNELTRSNANSLVPHIVGKLEILDERYFIIDPAIPSLNYMSYVSKEVIAKIKNFANNTIIRLDLQLRQREGKDFMQKLFKPMPIDLTKENQEICLPMDFLLSCSNCCNSIYTKVKIRNQCIREDSNISRVVKVLKNNLIVVIHSTVHGNPDAVTVNDVEKAVEYLIKNNFPTDLKGVGRSGKHSDFYDVQIRVPYIIKGKIYAVFLSMLWHPQSLGTAVIARLMDNFCNKT